MDDLTARDIPAFALSCLSSDAYFGGPDQMAWGPMPVSGALVAVPSQRDFISCTLSGRRIFAACVTAR